MKWVVAVLAGAVLLLAVAVAVLAVAVTRHHHSARNGCVQNCSDVSPFDKGGFGDGSFDNGGFSP